MVSKRQISYLSPRLGILNNIPFAIPFETRISIFRHFIANDMVSRSGGVDRRIRMGRGRLGTRITVHRGRVAQDGFDLLNDVDLKQPIEIVFVDQFGQPELVFRVFKVCITDFDHVHRAGIDGGGVFKEFLTSLCKEVFDTNHGLWLANKKNELYPNPHMYATESV
jgi:ubiquitin-protein ligase E3 C